jgi:hypothetical protein
MKKKMSGSAPMPSKAGKSGKPSIVSGGRPAPAAPSASTGSVGASAGSGSAMKMGGKVKKK